MATTVIPLKLVICSSKDLTNAKPSGAYAQLFFDDVLQCCSIDGSADQASRELHFTVKAIKRGTQFIVSAPLNVFLYDCHTARLLAERQHTLVAFDWNDKTLQVISIPLPFGGALFLQAGLRIDEMKDTASQLALSSPSSSSHTTSRTSAYAATPAVQSTSSGPPSTSSTSSACATLTTPSSGHPVASPQSESAQSAASSTRKVMFSSETVTTTTISSATTASSSSSSSSYSPSADSVVGQNTTAVVAQASPGVTTPSTPLEMVQSLSHQQLWDLHLFIMGRADEMSSPTSELWAANLVRHQIGRIANPIEMHSVWSAMTIAMLRTVHAVILNHSPNNPSLLDGGLSPRSPALIAKLQNQIADLKQQLLQYDTKYCRLAQELSVQMTSKLQQKTGDDSTLSASPTPVKPTEPPAPAMSSPAAMLAEQKADELQNELRKLQESCNTTLQSALAESTKQRDRAERLTKVIQRLEETSMEKDCRLTQLEASIRDLREQHQQASAQASSSKPSAVASQEQLDSARLEGLNEGLARAKAENQVCEEVSQKRVRELEAELIRRDQTLESMRAQLDSSAKGRPDSPNGKFTAMNTEATRLQRIISELEGRIKVMQQIHSDTETTKETTTTVEYWKSRAEVAERKTKMTPLSEDTLLYEELMRQREHRERAEEQAKLLQQAYTTLLVQWHQKAPRSLFVPPTMPTTTMTSPSSTLSTFSMPPSIPTTTTTTTAVVGGPLGFVPPPPIVTHITTTTETEGKVMSSASPKPTTTLGTPSLPSIGFTTLASPSTIGRSSSSTAYYSARTSTASSSASSATPSTTGRPSFRLASP